MADTATRLSVKTEGSKAAQPSALQAWAPLEDLRDEIDRIFESFQNDFWPGFGNQTFARFRSPAGAPNMQKIPAVDIADGEKNFEITADMPGLSEKDIQVTMVNGDLLIKGEKQTEKEEKKKDYYLQERSFGSFERRFRLPDGIDRNRVEATFSNGVLKIILPKSVEAQQAKKTIEVKAA